MEEVRLRTRTGLENQSESYMPRVLEGGHRGVLNTESLSTLPFSKVVCWMVRGPV